tara:strand:- start:395 stop:532 length:138 start_codon:yes stop_codon:yes gene_type:complete
MDQSELVLIGVVVLGIAFLGMVVWPLWDKWLDDLEDDDDDWTDRW